MASEENYVHVKVEVKEEIENKREVYSISDEEIRIYSQQTAVVKIKEEPQIEDHSDDINNTIASGSQCQIDNKIFTQPANFAEQIESQREYYLCDICHKHFRTKNRLKVHLISHERSKMDRTCNVCSLQFSQRSIRNMHMRLHAEESQHKCHICFKKLSSEVSLKLHISHIHNRQPLFVCDICYRGFTNNKRLMAHMTSHENETPTNEKLTSLEKTQENVNSNTQDHPYECDLCYMRFSRLSNLQLHLSMHKQADMKIFKCDICPARYSNISRLIWHRRVHFERIE